MHLVIERLLKADKDIKAAVSFVLYEPSKCHYAAAVFSMEPPLSVLYFHLQSRR